MSIFSKLFGGKQDKPIIKDEIQIEPLVGKKAKPDTFDISFFKDGNGKFTFPKYNKIKSLVKITDNTKYKKDLALNKDEMLNYTFDDFETDYSVVGPDIEIEEFKSLFDKKELNGLPVISKLKGKDNLIEKILNSVESQDYYPLYLSEDIQQQLTKYGFIENVELDRNLYVEFISENNFFEDLKSLCSQNNIKPGQTKSKTVERLLDANVSFPKAFKITNEFINYINELSKLYISNIEYSLGIIHPLFHQTIWEEAENINDFLNS